MRITRKLIGRFQNKRQIAQTRMRNNARENLLAPAKLGRSQVARANDFVTILMRPADSWSR